jgi:DNA-binding GntR family transcriptional regulator
MNDGKPYRMRVRRALERLANDGLLTKYRGRRTITKDGHQELNRADRKTNAMFGVSQGEQSAKSACSGTPAVLSAAKSN